MLTKGNITRDQWNNLLHLFNISHFSSLCCAQKFSLTSCTRTMAKKMQEQEGEERIVAKSKPTTMNLAVSVSTSSSTVNSPIASTSPETLKAPCRTDWLSSGSPAARNSNYDAASSSQGWQKDALMDGGTGKFVATEEDQEHLNHPWDFECTGKLVAPGDQGYPGTPGDSGDSAAEGHDKDWPHHLHISTKLCATSGKGHLDRGTNIWSQSDGWNERAVHLGKDDTESLRSTKNQHLKSVKRLFQKNERSRIRQIKLDWPRLTGSSLWGKRLLC